jgi:hypothetical protein
LKSFEKIPPFLDMFAAGFSVLKIKDLQEFVICCFFRCQILPNAVVGKKKAEEQSPVVLESRSFSNAIIELKGITRLNFFD